MASNFSVNLVSLVFDQVSRLLAAILQLHQEVTGLLLHPRADGLAGHHRYPDAAGSDMDEKEDVVCDLSASRPNVLREKVACPEGVHVALDKAVPVTLGSVGAGMKAVLDKDLLDRIGCHRNPELLELPLDSTVAPVVLSCEPQD